MWLGGAALTEVVFAVLYALSILGWAWAVAPISRRAALATALVLLLAPPYAGPLPRGVERPGLRVRPRLVGGSGRPGLDDRRDVVARRRWASASRC